jgi:hypothetical protein
MVAYCRLQDGRWVRTDTGYRLEGPSLAVRPARTPNLRRVLLLCLLPLVVLAGVLFCLRRRQQLGGAAPTLPAQSPTP